MDKKKKWYKKFWVWILIVVGVFVLFAMFGGGSDSKDSESNTTTGEVKKASSSKSSASSKSSSSASSSSTAKKANVLKFGEVSTFKQDDALMDVTVTSAKKVSPDDDAVSYLKKGQGEYLIISYTVTAKKGSINPYDFSGDHLSISGQDGTMGESRTDYGGNMPESVSEGKSLDMTAVATLKNESPTLTVIFKNVEWQGDISQ